MKKTKDGRRQFSREFKIEAVKRVQDGEKPAAVARNLRIRLELLSRWCRQARTGGEAALRSVGRPRGRRRPGITDGETRVAELERLVGRQQAAIDFLEQALRRVEALRQAKRGNGATASSK